MSVEAIVNDNGSTCATPVTARIASMLYTPAKHPFADSVVTDSTPRGYGFPKRIARNWHAQCEEGKVKEGVNAMNTRQTELIDLNFETKER